MTNYKNYRMSKQLHASLKAMADSHAMDLSEVARRLLRQWRKAMQGVGKTEFLKVPTLIDSDVVSLDLPHSLIVGLGGRDICAVIAWGLSRPCNPMAPKLKLYIDEEPYIIEEAKEDNGQ